MELPAEFKQYATEALGAERANVLFSQIDKGEEITSVRANPLKGISAGDMPGMIESNEAVSAGEDCIGWCKLGRYLLRRPVFTLDPLFHAGGYYVQEAGSMYMEIVRDAIEADEGGKGFFSRNINVLDLCAAPGGKSTHIVSLLGKDSLLVSNEVIKSRSVVLADNIAKWGADNVVVTNNDPADFKAFEGWFNLIVVDAPCSGEGLFRKDPQAVEEWSPANVNLCAARQQRILADIWPALAPGGYLVYSTCTYNKFENDGNLAFLRDELGATILPLSGIAASSEPGVLSTELGGLQFVPGLVKSEGQFVALVRKGEDGASYGTDSHLRKWKKGGKEGKKNALQREKGCNYLPDNYIMLLQGDLVKGYRDLLFERIRFVEDNLRCVLSGVAVANKKGKDYVPHADLALQCIMAEMVRDGKLPAGISASEVGKDEALKFLAKEPLLLPDSPMGYVLLVYCGLPLGFVKNLGNRTNNLLPMARRIRMEIR